MASSSQPAQPHDTSVMKVEARTAPRGPNGEKYLASGVHTGLRIFEDVPAHPPREPDHGRAYELAGYVVKGRVKLTVNGQPRELATGDAYVVPAGTAHHFEILEGPMTAVEATAPVAWLHDRDAPARAAGQAQT